MDQNTAAVRRTPAWSACSSSCGVTRRVQGRLGETTQPKQELKRLKNADNVQLEWDAEISPEKLSRLLQVFGSLLPDPLADRVNLDIYARKLKQHALIALAKADGEDVGILALYANDPVNRTGFVSLLSVLPAYQNRGIGRALVTSAIAVAGQRGMKALRLTLSPGNRRALALYASLGFRPAGTMGGKPVLEVLL